ncbi:hypothetical protein MKY41_15440 [Sporosarcina sp. FSL W7-1349]|uniref:hypothetical protein n=1 Tax=Bacillales TaxID=1385 RepID=UPI00058205E2|nr:hypothetical protein [Bacillus sp. OxB-1]BAQ08958.1 hypothetical protein OXB_0486 [Bacillus sp. OxB-1]
MTGHLARTKRIAVGTLQTTAILYLFLLTLSLVLTAFSSKEEPLPAFANNQYQLMKLNEEHVIGKANADGRFDVLLTDVKGYWQGAGTTYIAGGAEEFLVIDEKTGAFHLKKIQDATSEEAEELAKITIWKPLE